eukprot:CAMPEP_0197586616 /NCGR_PEP_ID=MMETSP1326-20131121/8534_1 /TAXON_ID=1155430 /ORGANISM="Genus nov. species nov., Strain RCC2288" /LENGTH=49 /DNA_ID=CAMNT_0043151261 /DNA_START=20 /DNA_END=169 /DNA_ORIENTATION=+
MSSTRDVASLPAPEDDDDLQLKLNFAGLIISGTSPPATAAAAAFSFTAN